MSFEFDIIAETEAGNHILLAQCDNRQYGAIVGEAIFEQYHAAPAGFQIRYVWLRDMADPRTPRLMDAWPARWKDWEGWQASVAAWKASPRGVSGSQPAEREAEAERYNREIDERNRISQENREKPWLPLHDGE